MKILAICIYLWAGFWTGAIGAHAIHEQNPLVQVAACVTAAALWPLFLPSHLLDLKQ